MKKTYTLNLVKTASDDYIKDIKQAMIDKGIVEETVPDNELDEAISNFESKGDIKSYTFTTNGVYDKLYSTEEFTINRNDPYDFTVGMVAPIAQTLQFRKLGMFSVPEHPELINSNSEYKFFMTATVSGQTITDQLSFGDLLYTFNHDEGVGYFDNSQLSGAGVILMPFIKNATLLNTLFNTDKFEDNSVYISDAFFIVLEELAGASFDDVSVTIYAPGKKLIDGVFPVTVDVALKTQDSVTFTANGTYTPSNGYEGFKQVIVDNQEFKQHVFDGAITKYTTPDSNTGDYIPFKIKDYTTSIRYRKYGLAGSTYHTIDLTGLSTNSSTGEMTKGYEIAKGFFKACEAYKIITPAECPYFYFHEECFADMPNLTEFYTGLINNSSGGAYIYNDVFKGCVSLEKFKIEGLAPILNDGYAGNTVDGTAYMLVNTFAGCTNLKTVIFDIPIKYARQVPKQYNAFPDNPDLLLYFQDTSIDLVKADSTYADLLDKIKPLSEYVEE